MAKIAPVTRMAAAMLGLISAGLLGTSAPAGAAVLIGPDLTPVPPEQSIGCSALYTRCSFIQVASGTSGMLVAAPSDGVITRWRFRGRCCFPTQATATRMHLRTFAPGPNAGNPPTTAVGIAAGPVFEVPPLGMLHEASIIDVPVRVPIATGQWIGVGHDQPASIAVYDVPGLIGGIGDISPEQADGVEGSMSTRSGWHLAMNATVEPDADRDGYGDETQDCQPTDPTNHPSCAVTTQPPPQPVFIPPPPTPVAGGGGCQPACKGGGVVFLPPVPSDGSVLVIAIRCSPTSTLICGGRLLVNVAGKSGTEFRSFATATRLLGSSRYSVAPGKTARIRVKLNALGRRLLAQKKRLTVTLKVVPTTGEPMTVRKVIRLAKGAPVRN